MKELVKTLVGEFDNKEYAHAYLEEFSNMEIATQIKVLREQRGLTQAQLADLAGMKQERICALEDVDYRSWMLKTLRKLAEAFDLSLKVSFESFSNRAFDVDGLSRSKLERASRDEDLVQLSKDLYQDSTGWSGNVVSITDKQAVVMQDEHWQQHCGRQV